MTNGDVMQGQRMPWASPPGAEASTPGALLYHDRTPASPLNMLLLNGQPAQQDTPAKEPHAPSADMTSPPDLLTPSFAQQNGIIDSDRPEQLAEAVLEALASAQVNSGAARVSTEGNPQTSKQTAPAAAKQAAQPRVEAHAAAAAGAAPAESPTAPEALHRSSVAQPPPARKPKGKGFLFGTETLAAQQATPEDDQGTSQRDQPAEHQSSPLVTTASRSAPAPAQPDATNNGPSASPAHAQAGQHAEPAARECQEPAVNKHSKQSSQTGEAEVSRQSPDLEIASVHQAVEAVQVRPSCASFIQLSPPAHMKHTCFLVSYRAYKSLLLKLN